MQELRGCDCGLWLGPSFMRYGGHVIAAGGGGGGGGGGGCVVACVSALLLAFPLALLHHAVQGCSGRLSHIDADRVANVGAFLRCGNTVLNNNHQLPPERPRQMPHPPPPH